MAEIKKPGAYFSTMVKNSYKDEFRSNDNFYNHISSVGDESDVQVEISKSSAPPEGDTDSIEQRLGEGNATNWLLFMENKRLHRALSKLPAYDLNLVYMLYVLRLNQAECADILGINQGSISKRHNRIKNILSKFLKRE